MLDASGRIPQAITQGNRRDVGTYDQCVNIYKKLDVGEVKGKYCYAGLAIPLAILNNTSIGPVQNIMNDISETMISDFLNNAFTAPTAQQRVANNPDEIDVLLIPVCIPSVCLPSELFDLMGVDNFCHTKNQNQVLDAGDITCL